MIWKKVRFEISPGTFQYFVRNEGIPCCTCGAAKDLSHYIQFGMIFKEKYRMFDFMCSVCCTWRNIKPEGYLIFGGYFG